MNLDSPEVQAGYALALADIDAMLKKIVGPMHCTRQALARMKAAFEEKTGLDKR